MVMGTKPTPFSKLVGKVVPFYGVDANFFCVGHQTSTLIRPSMGVAHAEAWCRGIEPLIAAMLEFPEL